MGLKGRNLLKKMDFTSSRSHRTCVYKCGDACSKPVNNKSDNNYFMDLIQGTFSRRTALRTGGAAMVTVGGASFLAACSDDNGEVNDAKGGNGENKGGGSNGDVEAPEGLKFEMVEPNTKDEVVVPAGYKSEVVIRWGDPVEEGAEEFDVDNQTAEQAAKQYGFNCDLSLIHI